MASFFKKKRSFENDGNQETPFCHTLSSFLANSTRQQVFYANLEGSYDRRRFDTKDVSFILEYVYNTLYYSEDANIPPVWNETELKQIQELCGLSKLNSLLRLNEEKSKHCRKISEKIVSLSKTFKWVDEIHLCCIWIYYFDYRDSEEKATPVFKIYKEKSGDAAVFLDVNLNVYDNWNAYLDTATFPMSFLCVPRHGNYSFVGEQLDLEFFCKTSLKNHHNNFEKNNFKPFSQKAIHSWLEKFRLLGREIQEKIIGIATAFLNRLQNSKVSFSTLAIFCVVLAVKVYTFYRSPGPFISNLENLPVMLFDISRFLDFEEFILSTVKSTVGVTSFTCPVGPPIKEKFQELINLCRQSTKNWLKIFHVMITLLRKAGPTVKVVEFALRSVCPSPVVVTLFEAFHQVIKFEQFFGNYFETQKTTPSLSSPESSLSPIYSDGKKETQKVVNPEKLRTFLKKWDLLEKLPADSVQSMMEEERVHSFRNSEPSHPIPLAVVEDLVVLFIPGLSAPALNDYCLSFIGTNVRIHPVSRYDSEVILDTGEVLGNLHFVDEFCAFGIFKIANNSQLKLLEGLGDVQIK